MVNNIGFLIAFLKLSMTRKIIAAYLKGFPKYRRIAFLFLEYLCFVL